MNIKRNKKYLDAYISTLQELGINYKIRHGTYTTKVIHDLGRKTFSSMKLSNKTFIGANMVKKDVLESDFFHEIKDKKFSTANYDYNKSIQTMISYQNTFNIDITSAYAHALLIHNLITPKTFDYITQLPKSDRLIVVGMLARSYSEFSYDSTGKQTGLTFHKEPTSNAFMFLINEIDQLMKDCAFYLGKHFYFYWVDGIFFNAQVSDKTIKKVENILEGFGYPYKYEDIGYFDMSLDTETNVMTAIVDKNGEKKVYTWGRDINYDLIKTYIYEKFKYGKEITI